MAEVAPITLDDKARTTRFHVIAPAGPGINSGKPFHAQSFETWLRKEPTRIYQPLKRRSHLAGRLVQQEARSLMSSIFTVWAAVCSLLKQTESRCVRCAKLRGGKIFLGVDAHLGCGARTQPHDVACRLFQGKSCLNRVEVY